ncbi:MAG TPA: Gfo/Idh/MocA family oxidoreductase [Dongiaceae bacterium]|nr:Gfo/Idh/MocA family oxidoreductase [Dongiaceae bacterium]
MAKTYAIAVIGIGKITEDQHLPVIAKNPRFALAALVSQRGVARPGVPSFKTIDALLDSGTAFDAVAICTPPNVRHAIARRAIDSGKHLLLEKPTTATVTESEDLARRVAAKKGCVAFATWHSQYNAAVEEARRLLMGQRIARLHVEWKEDVRRWHPGQEWIWAPGGFGVFDPTINAFSILTRILPEPLFITAAELTTPANRETPIAARIAFRSDAASADAPLSAEVDWRQTGPQSWNIDIETESGTKLALRDGGSKLAVDGRPKVEARLEEYERIYERFAEMLDQGEGDMDYAPLRLVADAFLVGKRVETDPFEW